MKYVEVKELLAEFVAQSVLEAATDEAFLMMAWTERCWRKLAATQAKIDKGAPYSAATPMENAVEAQKAAMAHHDELWELIGEKIGRSDIVWDAFCEAEILRTKVRDMESSRQASIRRVA